MVANNDNGSRQSHDSSAPGHASHETTSRLNEPPLFRSRENRWHDAALLGFLTLTLIAAVVGLIGTIAASSPT